MRDWIDRSRAIWFLRLVFRPHPYAYPCPWWRAWTTFLVLPGEAWVIAGIMAECP